MVAGVGRYAAATPRNISLFVMRNHVEIWTSKVLLAQEKMRILDELCARGLMSPSCHALSVTSAFEVLIFQC
jgi:hypothetical protein